MTITFRATSKSLLRPSSLPEDEKIGDPLAMVQRTKAYDSACGKGSGRRFEVFLVRGTSGQYSSSLGLVGTIVRAYNSHHNLELRPDDVWVAILTQFSAYVNGRSEALRSKFVSHQGQKPLEVVGPGVLETTDYGWFTGAMLEVIKKHLVDPSLSEWFLPGFSTTTETDHVCAAATAMCTFQKYFTYKFSLRCGIPNVTLLGTIEDWEWLRKKIERLFLYDDNDKLISSEWLPLLRIVCDNFVESAKHGSTHNLGFWDTVACREGGGSGPTYLSGWASVFTYFDKDGKVITKKDVEIGAWAEFPKPKPGTVSFTWPLVDMQDINPNVVSCPVTIDDNGTIYQSQMFVGQMSFDSVQDPDHNTRLKHKDNEVRHRLIPRNDWVLVVEKRNE